MEKRGYEIEAKFRLKPGQRDAIAHDLAGHPHHHLTQEDRYFDVPGRVLRLRHEGNNWLLTRKDAPAISPDGTRTRVEFEAPIPSELVPTLSETFAWLGHRPLMIVHKVRDEYHVEGVTVCLDRIQGLDGDFAELEILSLDSNPKEQLSSLRHRFCLEDDQVEPRSYAKLLADAQESPRSPTCS